MGMLDWVPRRVRLVSARRDSNGPAGSRFNVQLERSTGESFSGNAAADDPGASELRVAAEATLDALRRAIGEAADIQLRGVLPFSAFGENLVVVGIKVTHDGQSQRLFGMSPITDDRGRAAALATLNAANRFLGLG